MKPTHFHIIPLALVAAVLLVYYPVHRYDFVSFDDGAYVYENVHVIRGLTGESVRWAFTTGYNANWHPLTWLSHMLDSEMYGMWPGGHHLTNVLLHCVNTVLLFFLLFRMTGAVWRSATVAALFALHPLHVESVAWVSERKDVLSTLFGLGAMRAYLSYTRSTGTRRYVFYVAVACLFAFSLMAKPMLVTLPALLLVLDYWPLGRMRDQRAGRRTGSPFRMLLLEKVPLFALSAASSVITLLVQVGGGARPATEQFPPAACIANGFLSYVRYMGKTVLPSGLTVFYPFPAKISPIAVSLAVLLLVAITGVVIRARRGHEWLVTGWGWYLVSLLPVIGFVQVGEQAMADRYTYVPLIGLFVLLVWGVSAVARQRGIRPAILALLTVAFLAESAFASRLQLSRWRTTISLFRRVVEVNPGLVRGHHKLAMEYYRTGELGKAYQHLSQVLTYAPDSPMLHTHMGLVFRRAEQTDSAAWYFSRALKLDSGFVQAREHLEDLEEHAGTQTDSTLAP